MCYACVHTDVWDGCDYDDWTDEELEHIDDFNEDNCPYFLEYFPEEPDKYWREDR